MDDASADGTGEIAERRGAKVVRLDQPRSAGGARNRGWEEAGGDVVVFLDSDAVPAAGWSAGIRRAAEEFPRAVVAGARTFTARTRWGWVSHSRARDPYLPSGGPRERPTLSSFCLFVPRDAPLRWHESYGGEDGLFSVDAGGRPAPRVRPALPGAPRPPAREPRRATPPAAARRLRVRARPRPARGALLPPAFAAVSDSLLRLAAPARDLRPDPARPRAARRFLRLLPWLVAGEWLFGLSACRYVLRRPDARDPARTFG